MTLTLAIISTIAFCCAAVFFLLLRLAQDKTGKARYAVYRRGKIKRESLRTPDACFENLSGYPFAPNFAEVDELRMHYVDEGSRDGEVVLLLHGEPSWSYLYRKMIPLLAEAGHRVIAPDLIGFGKSDKLVRQADYSYQMHVDMIAEFINALDLRGITLFCQDWGSLIGLRVAVEDEGRFARIVVANGALPGRAPRGKYKPVTQLKSVSRKRNAAFLTWLAYSQFTCNLKAGDVLQMGTYTKLSDAEVAAYNAPYPDKRHLAGVRKFPRIVASELDKNSKAWEKWAQWDKPVLTLFSDKDPIMRGGDRLFQRVIPGAQGQAHCTIEKASHFLQEDKGEELAQKVNEFIAANSA